MAIIPWDPDLKYLYSAQGDGGVYTIDENGQNVALVASGGDLSTAEDGNGSTDPGDIAVTQDGRMFAVQRTQYLTSTTGSTTNSLKMWELVNNDGVITRELQTTDFSRRWDFTEGTKAMGAAPDGRLYFVTNDTGTNNSTIHFLEEQADGTWGSSSVDVQGTENIFDLEFISESQFLTIGEDTPGEPSTMRMVTIDPETGAYVGEEVVFADTEHGDWRGGLNVSKNDNGDLEVTSYRTNSVGTTYDELRVTFEGTTVTDGVVSWSSVTQTRTDDIPMTYDLSSFSGGAGGDWISSIICFARGTMIDTETGQVAVEDLCEGMLVRTKDNGLQPIRWIGSQVLSDNQLQEAQSLRPVRIKAGALGDNLPIQDLLVSPQHRILVRSKIAQRMFGTDEVLVAAKQLLEIDGIEVSEGTIGVEYFHFMFDQHEIVFANGAEAESLFTGPEAIKAVGEAAREEIFAIFPQLRDELPRMSVRPLIKGKLARKMASRHKRNNSALVNL